MTPTEPENVAARYQRRDVPEIRSLYDPFRTVNLLTRQERERALNRVLSDWLCQRPLCDAKILEIGCGSGANLLHLITLGATPSNMTANELLADRLTLASANLPSGVTLLPGDASTLAIKDGSLDIVVQSTVFSSLLDAGFRTRLAERMLAWLKPGGSVLWYDFTFDNPKNPDVKGMPMTEIRRLFPACKITSKRVTLAPPLARRLGPLTRLAYPALNVLPFLRTHLVCLIEKPKA